MTEIRTLVHLERGCVLGVVWPLSDVPRERQAPDGAVDAVGHDFVR
jgi:hypothetical protein